MTRSRLAIALVSFSTLTCLAAAAQQQFGPNPQAMYKQHPGSAPTYVNYGPPKTNTQVASLHQVNTIPAPTRSASSNAPTPKVKRVVVANARRKTTATSTSNTGR